MKKVLLITLSMITLTLSAQSQTPEQVYYQMIHNDSITTHNFEVIQSYGRIQTATKVMGLIGGIAVAAGVILSNEVSLNEPYTVPRALFIAGTSTIAVAWIMDWSASAKLKNRIRF